MACAVPDLPKILIAQGHLTDADNVVETSSAVSEENPAAYHGHVSALQGRVEAALDFFSTAAGGSDYGIWHSRLLSQLDRVAAARRLTEGDRDMLLQESGTTDESRTTDIDVQMCRLVLAELSLRQENTEDAADELQQVSNWALACDAKEVLCWSAMFRGRLELARFGEDGGARSDSLQQAAVATEEGLRIARDCGYAVFHVDLLLQQARVNLLRGRVESALADVSLAVEDGLPADEVTGRPDMPAASDKRFGYAWGIVEGLHLRGEAQLLQAAQRLGSATYTPRSRATPAEVRKLIAEAKRNLQKAMRRWKKLRDPEPPEDNNFVHPETGEEYNYRAAETYDVLTTRYPLQPPPDDSQPAPARPAEGSRQTTPAEAKVTTMATRDQVFISYSHNDTQYREELEKHLKTYLRKGTFKAWSDKQIKPGTKWYKEIQDALARTKVAVFLVSVDFLASDFIWDKELKPLLDEAEKKNVEVLWVPFRPCLVDETPLNDYQAIGNPQKPLAAMSETDRDAAWVDVCKVIKDTINR